MIPTPGAKRSVLFHQPPSPLNAVHRSHTLHRKTLRTTLATIQIMRTISLKIPANSATWTLNYACFEKEIQRRSNGRRTRCVYRSVSIPHPFPVSIPTSRPFYSLPFVASDVRPSSMVSFAEAAWRHGQRRKSDVLAQPTRSCSSMNRCKATTPSQTVAIQWKTMVRCSTLRPNTAQSRRRQGHYPRLQSLKNTPIKGCLNSLRTPRRRLSAPSWAPLTSSTSQKTRNLEKRHFSA